jgi:type II secretory ATPase GspE/PulE/Tfp pilus assembly ATPase PilB-like protein
MSDLSLPPLSLMPAEEEAFAWPTPTLAGYPAPAPSSAPLVCAVEGLNGNSMKGHLVHFAPGRGALQIRLMNQKRPLSLRTDQFRRLCLTESLVALTPPESFGDVQIPTPSLPFEVQFNDGEAWSGQTVGHCEEPWGLFLFEPMDSAGTLRRWFVPRAAYHEAVIGMRLGDLLVEQNSASPEQIRLALAEQQEMRNRKIGDILVVRQIISTDELAEAVEKQSKMPMVRIGEALTALGYITEAQLEDALHQQRQDRTVPLGELLVRKGMVSRADLQTALARKMGYPLVDVQQFPAESEALLRVPYLVATRVQALPLMLRAARLITAVEDPSDRGKLDELEFAAQCKIVPVLVRSGVLAGAIDRAYEKLGSTNPWNAVPVDPGRPVEFDADDAGKLLASMERIDAHIDDEETASIEQSDNSLVRLINSMITEAHQQQASDIHIECPAGKEKVRIRFRKDGLMRSYLELPSNYRNALIARIKIMCDLDISEKRKPQDGKINFSKFVPGVRLELRVATIPTSGNLEDAVLRLLQSSKPIPLENLGLSPKNLERLQAAAQRPNGMLLCVGPTGSGKTTTLHSLLGSINKPERKIWTAEDPVEITQPGLRQVQVNPRIEWTFAKALRAFLRADPDVIMVGEIRDLETAQVAIEASLTGHLLLSTLHTNSAPETITRLLDMGMDPFNFADALLCVLAQRLVRKLCTHCRVEHVASSDEEQELLRDHLHVLDGVQGAPSGKDVLASWRKRFGTDGKIKLYQAQGCERCAGTGFDGRAGLHELMVVSRGLRTLIQTGQRADELQRHALGEGMFTLRQDGIEKVLAGITTIEEVRSST